MTIFENWGHPGTQDTAPLYKIIEFHMGHPVGQLQSNLCNFWKSKNGKLLDFMRFDRLFWSHDNAIFFFNSGKKTFWKGLQSTATELWTVIQFCLYLKNSRNPWTCIMKQYRYCFPRFNNFPWNNVL